MIRKLNRRRAFPGFQGVLIRGVPRTPAVPTYFHAVGLLFPQSILAHLVAAQLSLVLYLVVGGGLRVV
jgi:hypothetical protein